ncbi:MAG: hypothetical protein M3R61_10430, partial [Chloroflexota bacterium]|nr:hypothetical protein [Chloroflexota bacterium]
VIAMSEPTEQQQYEAIFASYKEQARIVPIDTNMRTLIETLNQLDGIATVSCCGGHEHPARCQRPLGAWFVTFEVYPYDKRGWDALSIIRYATDQTNDRVSLRYAGLINGFSLDGKGIDPNDVAPLMYEVIL